MASGDPDPRWSVTAQANVLAESGHRLHLMSVSKIMSGGLLLTGLGALLVEHGGRLPVLLDPYFVRITLEGFALIAVTAGLALWICVGRGSISPRLARALFGTFAVLLGVALPLISLGYAELSFVPALLGMSAGFASLALYVATGRPPRRSGTFLVMGAAGAATAIAIGWFWMGDMVGAIVAVGSVLIAIVLTTHFRPSFTVAPIVDALRLYAMIVLMIACLGIALGARSARHRPRAVGAMVRPDDEDGMAAR